MLYDLDLFLGDTTAAGVRLIAFYHRELKTVAKSRYQTREDGPDFVEILSEYFESQEIWHSAEGNVVNVRRAYELAYQLRQLDDPTAADRMRMLLTDTRAVDGKIAARLSQDLLFDYLDFAVRHENLLPEIVSFFADALLTEKSSIARAFPPSEIQSYYAYQQDKTFYRELLEHVVTRRDGGEAHAESTCMRMQIDLAGLVRREANLDRARDLLRFMDEDVSILSPRNISVGWYERAYIRYLEDDYSGAIDYFQRSIEFSEQDCDQVGALITRGVVEWAKYYSNPSAESLSAVQKLAESSLELFTQKQYVDPRATRWVRNALAVLVHVGYFQRDPLRAEENMQALGANPWVQAFSVPTVTKELEARVHMTKKEYEEAVRIWEDYFQLESVKRDSEAIAWPMFDYGQSLEHLGCRVRAAQVYFDGLNTDTRRANNGYWHQRLRDQLAETSFWIKLIARVTKNSYSSPLGNPAPRDS